MQFFKVVGKRLLAIFLGALHGFLGHVEFVVVLCFKWLPLELRVSYVNFQALKTLQIENGKGET